MLFIIRICTRKVLGSAPGTSGAYIRAAENGVFAGATGPRVLRCFPRHWKRVRVLLHILVKTLQINLQTDRISITTLLPSS